MSYLEELLPEFRKGAKIRQVDWNDCEYIQFNGRYIHNQDGDEVLSCDLDFQDITKQNWEFYSEPEPDWDFLIKNKCLCYFWNKEERNKTAGVLEDYDTDGAYLREYDCYYDNCRPVCRDEVTFYEDREND